MCLVHGFPDLLERVTALSTLRTSRNTAWSKGVFAYVMKIPVGVEAHLLVVALKRPATP